MTTDTKTTTDLYDRWEPTAKRWKVRLQMGIGLSIPILLIVNILLHLYPCPELRLLDDLGRQHPLHVVGYALAVSAGVELAYMLFTPGPDEAIEPLILGLSAAVLLLVSDPDLARFELVLGVLAFTACIGFLFWVRSEYINKPKQPSRQHVAQPDAEDSSSA